MYKNKSLNAKILSLGVCGCIYIYIYMYYSTPLLFPNDFGSCKFMEFFVMAL